MRKCGKVSRRESARRDFFATKSPAVETRFAGYQDQKEACGGEQGKKKDDGFKRRRFLTQILYAENNYLDRSDATDSDQNSEELTATIELTAEQESEAYRRECNIKQR